MITFLDCVIMSVRAMDECVLLFAKGRCWEKWEEIIGVERQEGYKNDVKIIPNITVSLSHLQTH